jgi:hypothetical protein
VSKSDKNEEKGMTKYAVVQSHKEKTASAKALADAEKLKKKAGDKE